MRQQMIRGLAAATMLAGLGGCGRDDGLYPVRGRVTSKGEPAAGAVVTFFKKGVDSSRSEIPRGEVGPDGSFELATGEGGRGAAPGAYSVLVEWRQGPLRTRRRDSARSVGKAARDGKPILLADDRLRGRYLDIEHPRLMAEVKAGTNDLPAFEVAE